MNDVLHQLSARAHHQKMASSSTRTLILLKHIFVLWGLHTSAECKVHPTEKFQDCEVKQLNIGSWIVCVKMNVDSRLSPSLPLCLTHTHSHTASCFETQKKNPNKTQTNSLFLSASCIHFHNRKNITMECFSWWFYIQNVNNQSNLLSSVMVTRNKHLF